MRMNLKHFEHVARRAGLDPAALGFTKRRGRYGIPRSGHAGSTQERVRGEELLLLASDSKSGITDVRFQVEVPLLVTSWRLDFVYDEDGRTIYEDFKGDATKKDREYLLKKKLFLLDGPGPLRISEWQCGGPVVTEEHIPAGLFTAYAALSATMRAWDDQGPRRMPAAVQRALHGVRAAEFQWHAKGQGRG